MSLGPLQRHYMLILSHTHTYKTYAHFITHTHTHTYIQDMVSSFYHPCIHSHLHIMVHCLYVGLSHRCSKVFFSQSQLSVLCLVSYASTSMHILKNPKHWQQYHCLGTQTYCTHRQEWVALLLQLLCLTQARQPKFPARYYEVKKEEQNHV